MNRKIVFASFALVFAFALAAAAYAEDKPVTLHGQLLCAKCTLHEKDMTTCQNVVQVKNDKGDAQNYYVVKNDVAEKFGHVCSGTKDVMVTGKVSDKEGKKWIEASKIEEMKKS